MMQKNGVFHPKAWKRSKDAKENLDLHLNHKEAEVQSQERNNVESLNAL